jgi:hypothetical protein
MAFLIVFGAGTLLLGVAYVISILVTRARHEGTANWPKVTGTVKHAYVYQHERSTAAGTTTTYTPVVGYAYAVEGQDYQAHKRNFLPYDQASLTSKGEAEAIRLRYCPGSEVAVYYNPINPAQAVLEKPKAIAHMAVLWYGIVCILLGGGMIALGILL